MDRLAGKASRGSSQRTQAAEGNRGGSGVGNKMPEEKIGGEIMGRRNNTRTPKLTNFGDSFSFLRGKKRKTQPFEKFMLLPGPIEGTVLIPGGGGSGPRENWQRQNWHWKILAPEAENGPEIFGPPYQIYSEKNGTLSGSTQFQKKNCMKLA